MLGVRKEEREGRERENVSESERERERDQDREDRIKGREVQKEGRGGQRTDT